MAKPIIFLGPLTPTLTKLKEVIAEDEEIEISETEDLTEAIQLFGNKAPALLITSDPRKVLRFMASCKNIIKKTSSKVVLIAEKSVPFKASKKMDQLGLSDRIIEPIAPKTLLYKVNFLLRSLPKKSEGDDDYNQVRLKGEKNSFDEDETEIKEKEGLKEKIETNIRTDSKQKNLDFEEEEEEENDKDKSNHNDIDEKNASKKNKKLDLLEDQDSDSSNNSEQDGLYESDSKTKKNLSLEIEDDESSKKNEKSEEDYSDSDLPNKKNLHLEIENDENLEENSTNNNGDVAEDEPKKHKNLALDIENDFPDLEEELLAIEEDDNNLNLKKNKTLELEQEPLPDIKENEASEDDESYQPNRNKKLEIQDDFEDPILDSNDNSPKNNESKRKSLELEIQEEDTEVDNKSNNKNEDEFGQERRSLELNLDDEQEQDNLPKEKSIEDELGLASKELSLDIEEDNDLEKGPLKLDIEPDDESEDKNTDDLLSDSEYQETKTKKLNLEEEDEEKEQDQDLGKTTREELEIKRTLELSVDDEHLEDEKSDKIQEIEDDDNSLTKNKTLEIEEDEKTENNNQDNGYIEDDLVNKKINQSLEVEDDGSGKEWNARENEIDDDWSHNIDKKEELALDVQTEEDSSEDLYGSKKKKNSDIELEIDQESEKEETSEKYHKIKDQKKTGKKAKFEDENPDPRKKSQAIDNEAEEYQLNLGPKEFDDENQTQEIAEEIPVLESKEEQNRIYDPSTMGIEYTIQVLSMYADKKIPFNRTLEFIANGLEKEKGGLTTFYYKKPTGYEIVYSLHENSDTSPEIKSKWEQESKTKFPIWAQASLPDWEDHTFEALQNTFTYPIFEGTEQIGLIVSTFQDQIKNENDCKIAETLLESSRGVFLELYHIENGEDDLSDKKKKTKKKDTTKKKSFFGNLFGKKAS